ncbi:MAG: SDR family oxidoreductase [Bacteroidetes bacterium]|nr:MAG: SDR family oxidoreductase [Bacteroidota bacterium]
MLYNLYLLKVWHTIMECLDSKKIIFIKMKNIIITGSSNGFGLKAAKDFADKGNKVFATMRNPNGKNATAKADLENHSTNIKVLDMDVTNDASVKEAMSTILAEAGNIDILINNAGIMYLGITEAFSVEQAKFQMETNYFGAIRVMQAILPSMRKAGSGLIINTSSLVGRMSPPFFGTYTATKHALEGYSQALRYEVSPFGVDIVLVEPGPFGTGLLESGQAPAHNEVLETYGELAGVPTAMGENFAQMLQSENAPDPQWVVDAYMKLADLTFGSRPTRTVVGITWGTDEINNLTQSIQDRILKEMQLEEVLGGVSA